MGSLVERSTGAPGRTPFLSRALLHDPYIEQLRRPTPPSAAALAPIARSPTLKTLQGLPCGRPCSERRNGRSALLDRRPGFIRRAVLQRLERRVQDDVLGAGLGRRVLRKVAG